MRRERHIWRREFDICGGRVWRALYLQLCVGRVGTPVTAWLSQGSARGRARV